MIIGQNPKMGNHPTAIYGNFGEHSEIGQTPLRLKPRPPRNEFPG
jgi:hypothetical protein